MLTLRHVTEADGGRYDCVADNDVRSAATASVVIGIRSRSSSWPFVLE